MPCYDKKLEATKGEFIKSDLNKMDIETESKKEDKPRVPLIKEVDTCITTEELLDIINKH